METKIKRRTLFEDDDEDYDDSLIVFFNEITIIIFQNFKINL